MSWSFPFCPEPPDWSLDWQAIERRFDWVRRMAGVQQNPLYHAEGDVLTHTRMVVEALVDLSAWRELPANTRSVLFAAALLHDVGKPLTTRIEADGSLTSRGHVPRGARFARQLFFQAFDLQAPFAYREQIVALVRHSGLPFYFLEEEPRRAVIRASQTVRCDWLAVLASADARGRICADKNQLLDKIGLFAEFCAENDCLEKPRPFATDHSRFVYFRKDDGDPDYVAYDDTRSEVVLMSALPGTGKDYWIRHHLGDWPVVSLDALRTQYNIEPDEEQGAVVRAAREQARVYLRRQQPFVWNATNTTRSLRGRLIDLFAAYGARVKIVYLEVPLDVLLERNSGRAEPVPEPVIFKLAERLDVPDLTEAHQIEWVIGPASGNPRRTTD